MTTRLAAVAVVWAGAAVPSLLADSQPFTSLLLGVAHAQDATVAANGAPVAPAVSVPAAPQTVQAPVAVVTPTEDAGWSIVDRNEPLSGAAKTPAATTNSKQATSKTLRAPINKASAHATVTGQTATASTASPTMVVQPTPGKSPSLQKPRRATRKGANKNVAYSGGGSPTLAGSVARAQASSRRLPAIRFIAPPAPVSKKKQAAAWPFVERAAKALKAKKFAGALSLYRRALAIDPNNRYALDGAADTLLILKRYAEAETAYRRVLGARPYDIKAQSNLAEIYVIRHNYPAAEAMSRLTLRQKPRDFAANYRLAQILTWTKRPNESIPFYRVALSLERNNAEAWTAWAEALSYTEHGAQARANFARALQLEPNSGRARLGLANLLSWSNDYPAAIAAYHQLLVREPRNVAGLIGLGDALTFSRQPAEATPFYRQALAIAPRSFAARLGLGRALVFARQFREGLPDLQRAVREQPNNLEALRLLAVAQAGRAGSPSADNAAALLTYRALLARQIQPEDQAQTWAAIANLENESGHFDRAREAYEKAIALAPTTTEISVNYAQLLIAEGELQDAEKVVESALLASPNNVRSQILQVVIENRLGNKDRAVALARALEAADPATPEEALQLANALREAGNSEGARRVITRLAAAVPEDRVMALQIANAVRDSGEFEGAVALYNRLIERDANDIETRLNLAEVLIWQKEFDAAQEQIDFVLRRDPNNVDAKIKRATILLREQTPETLNTAGSELAAILKTDPKNQQALAANAQLLSLRQKFAESVGGFRAVLDLDPNNLPARLGLARNLYYSRQVEESVQEYQDLLRRTPDDTRIKLELAQIYLDRNRLSDAETLFNQVIAARRALLPPLRDGRPTMRANAVASSALAAPFLSRAHSSKVLSSAPKVFSGDVARVQIISAAPRLAQATAPDSTKDGTSSNINSAPNNPATGTAPANNSAPANGANAPDAAATRPNPAPVAPPVASAPPATVTLPVATTTVNPEADQITALRGLGEIRRRQQRFDEAIDYFESALKIDAADASARLGLAQSLRGKGDNARSLTEVESVLGADAQNLNARVLHAQLLGDLGRNAEAQTELDALVASLQNSKPSAENYQALAQAFSNLRNYDAALQLLEAARHEYPAEPIIGRTYAETLTFARRYEDALKAYDALLAVDAKDTDALLGRSRVFNYSNRLSDAEASYRRLLELEPDNYSGLVELGDVLGRRNNYPEAIALYRTAIEKNANDLQPRLELARVLRYNGDYEASETTLNAILGIDARYAPALVERGILRGQRGNPEAGLVDLKQALEITPNDINAQFGLAEVQSYAKQYDESIKNYRAALERDPQNQKGRTELGLALSYAGRYDEALTELNAVLVQSPQNVNARIGKADVLARSRHTFQAIALYQEILQADPRNVRARSGLAEAYVYAGRYPDAIRTYDALIAAQPDQPRYRLARARVMGYSGRSREAIAALRPLATSDNLEARLALAELLTNSGATAGRGEARGIYNDILQSQPQNLPARIGLGRALSYDGRYKEAEAQLNQVLEQSPQNTEALYALAETQRFDAKYFDARDTYQRVIALDPTNARAREGLRLANRNTRSSVTVAARHFNDTNGVTVNSIIAGPTFVTRQGTVGVTYEKGRFSDDGASTRRDALNLLLARNFGPLSARLVLTRLSYGNFPDKTLYDLTLQRSTGSRTRYFVGASRNDIFESLGAVQRGITARQLRAGVDFPIARRLDLEGRIVRYNYSDSNTRTTTAASLYYRLRQGTPTARIGLGYRRDNTKFFSPLYYTPQDYNALSILGDYVVDAGRARYGLFAQHPLTNRTGSNNNNRPADTLFGYANYDLSELVELFLNGGIVRSPNYHSNDLTAGATFRW